MINPSTYKKPNALQAKKLVHVTSFGLTQSPIQLKIEPRKRQHTEHQSTRAASENTTRTYNERSMHLLNLTMPTANHNFDADSMAQL